MEDQVGMDSFIILLVHSVNQAYYVSFISNYQILMYVCVLFRHKRLYFYALQNMTESSPKAIHMDMVHGTVKMVQYLKANFVTADQAEKLHT